MLGKWEEWAAGSVLVTFLYLFFRKFFTLISVVEKMEEIEKNLERRFSEQDRKLDAILRGRLK